MQRKTTPSLRTWLSAKVGSHGSMGRPGFNAPGGPWSAQLVGHLVPHVDCAGQEAPEPRVASGNVGSEVPPLVVAEDAVERGEVRLVDADGDPVLGPQIGDRFEFVGLGQREGP